MADLSFFDKRVLIVEDEVLVALFVEDILLDLGCTVVGTYGSVASALKAVEGEAPDLAVLDINLKGEMSFPIAEALHHRGIPFLFMSGYGERMMPAAHPEWSVCTKPFKQGEFVKMLSAAVIEPSGS